MRYGRNTNSQVYGAGAARACPRTGATATNKFNSINVNHNWVLGGSKLNEFIFQYADFEQPHRGAHRRRRSETFPNGVTIGYNTNTPQTTEQHKYQFRDDFSWHVTGHGRPRPRLQGRAPTSSTSRTCSSRSASGSADYAYTHLDQRPATARSAAITRNKPGASANLPMEQYGFYIQDDWRVTDRLTVNAGLRYDLVTGFLIDQSKIPNFVALTGAAAAGRFNGVPGFDEFGKKAQEDKNNWQPRVGAVLRPARRRPDVVRAGWGIYYDFGFTNANILFPGLSAQGGSGVVFDVNNTGGIRNPDGSFFRVGQPISQHRLAERGQPERAVLQLERGGAADPAAVHEPDVGRAGRTSSTRRRCSTSTTCTSTASDLGVRWPLNTRIAIPAATAAPLRRSAAQPGEPDDEHEHRREHATTASTSACAAAWTNGIQLNAWYTLSKATGRGGQAVDELTTNLVQDSTNPLRRRAVRPGGAHRRAPQGHAERRHPGCRGASRCRRSSATARRCRCTSGTATTTTSTASATTSTRPPTGSTGVDDAGVPTFEEMGACETVNCGRGAALSQFNLRVSKAFRVPRRASASR